MNDPFEDPTSTALSPHDAIEQAVTFLNDPRVRNADQAQALSFLRRKGIKEDEIREAYRRSGLPYPTHSAPPAAQFPQTLTPYGMPPAYAAPTRPSWISVFLGITAAAGIYTAARELLRRYIVPLYFPDAARIVEERRRREEHAFGVQERQLVELRESIEQLVSANGKTNENVESLSRSLSSSMAMIERQMSQHSDIVQQISQSLSVSERTETSRVLQSTPGYEDRVSMGGFMGRDKGIRRSVEIRTDDVKEMGVKEGGKDGGVSADNGDERMLVNNFISGKTNDEAGSEKGQEDDEFMAIAPAEVQESWTGAGSVKETARKWETFVGSNDAEGGDVEGDENKMVNEVVAADEGETKTTAADGLQAALARQLFETDVMRETQRLFARTDKDGEKVRPLSMPQMDTPLSDHE